MVWSWTAQAQDLASGPGLEGSGNRASFRAKKPADANDFRFRTTSHTSAGPVSGRDGVARPYAYYTDRVGRFRWTIGSERGQPFFEGVEVDDNLGIVEWLNLATSTPKIFANFRLCAPSAFSPQRNGQINPSRISAHLRPGILPLPPRRALAIYPTP
jgi:hypothetical protein